ncbi:MAG: sugar-phosphatase [Peptostreptococcaceae bacterium]
MYKLIALDIDGTLLNSDKKITTDVFDSIQEAKKSGAKVVLSTGRPLPGVTPLLNELNLTDEGDFVICFNGAVVQEVKSERVISNIEMSHNDFVNIYSFAKEVGTNIHISTPTNVVTPQEVPSEFTVLEATLNQIPIVYMPEEEINDAITFCKVMIIDESDKLDEISQNIPKELSDNYTIVRSAKHFLEFLNKKANKGNALKALCENIDMPIEKTIAVGDEENDRHMIELAGLGVAMGNARDSIKEIANHITKTNNEHGVAHVINEFILNRKA